MSKFYAVKKGLQPGIYRTWDEAKQQVHQFKGAEYKSFKTQKEADLYLNNQQNNVNNQQNFNQYDLIIYTDGSCQNKKGGYGLVFIQNDNKLDIKTFYDKVPFDPCTNNIAELYAIKQALLLADKNQTILLKSDSLYAINSVQGHYQSVKNGELIKECIDLVKQFKMTFEHVYAHQGEYYNEMVDQLAKQGVLKNDD
jgi:ribonuclease HI